MKQARFPPPKNNFILRSYHFSKECQVAGFNFHCRSQQSPKSSKGQIGQKSQYGGRHCNTERMWGFTHVGAAILTFFDSSGRSTRSWSFFTNLLCVVVVVKETHESIKTRNYEHGWEGRKNRNHSWPPDVNLSPQNPTLQGRCETKRTRTKRCPWKRGLQNWCVVIIIIIITIVYFVFHLGWSISPDFVFR